MTDELPVPHKWRTLIVRMVRRGFSAVSEEVAEMECNVCGVTGKRQGTGLIKRDNQYKGERFRWCNTAQEHMEKLRNK